MDVRPPTTLSGGVIPPETERGRGDGLVGGPEIVHLAATVLPPPDMHPVDITTEFPAYLGPQHEAKVNQAIASILRRLQIPYVHPEKPGEITAKGFFAELEKHIQAQAAGAKVYISGGVVRSLLGYIYKKIYNEHQRALSQNPEPAEIEAITQRVLDRIIKGASRKAGTKEGAAEANKELAQLRALGIGSDLDILVEYPEGTSPKTKAAIQTSATNFINSAEKISGLRDVTDATLKKSLVPVGDVKEYHKQINRTTAQGGSTLDWLAFPLSQASGTGVRMPETYPGIMTNFFRGQVDYLPGGSSEDLDKQTVRGLRPLLELPFLQLTPTGKKQLLKELNNLRGKPLSSKAQEQFEKMVRNARLKGGHNRFAKPNEADLIAMLVHQISVSGARGDKAMPLIPEFTRKVKIATRTKDTGGAAENQWLMPTESFRTHWTDKGVVYHGTPKIEYVLSMIRNGLMLSIPERQGTAAHGAGVYSAKNKRTSSEYIGSAGTVLEFPVNSSENLRVLDLQDFKTRFPVQFAAFVGSAMEAKQDINQYLAEQLDLDFIVSQYPLIMNSDAVQIPKNAADLIKAKLSGGLREALQGSRPRDFFEEEDDRVKPEEFFSYQEMGRAMGLPGVPSITERNLALVNCFQDSSVSDAAFEYLLKFKPIDIETKRKLEGFLNDTDAHVRLLAVKAIRRSYPSSSESNVWGLHKDSDASVAAEAIEYAGEWHLEECERLILQGIPPASPNIAQQAAFGILVKHTPSSDVILKAALVSNRYFESAKKVLGNPKYWETQKLMNGLSKELLDPNSNLSKKNALFELLSGRLPDEAVEALLIDAWIKDPRLTPLMRVFERRGPQETYPSETGTLKIIKQLNSDVPGVRQQVLKIIRRAKMSNLSPIVNQMYEEKNSILKSAIIASCNPEEFESTPLAYYQEDLQAFSHDAEVQMKMLDLLMADRSKYNVNISYIMERTFRQGVQLQASAKTRIDELLSDPKTDPNQKLASENIKKKAGP